MVEWELQEVTKNCLRRNQKPVRWSARRSRALQPVRETVGIEKHNGPRLSTRTGKRADVHKRFMYRGCDTAKLQRHEPAVFASAPHAAQYTGCFSSFKRQTCCSNTTRRTSNLCMRYGVWNGCVPILSHSLHAPSRSRMLLIACALSIQFAPHHHLLVPTHPPRNLPVSEMCPSSHSIPPPDSLLFSPIFSHTKQQQHTHIHHCTAAREGSVRNAYVPLLATIPTEWFAGNKE